MPPPIVLVCSQPTTRWIKDPTLEKRFVDTTYWDLSHSGAIHPLLELERPKSHLAMKQAGANFLLESTIRRKWSGKLVLHAEVIDLRSESSVFRKAYIGEEKLLLRMTHILVDDLVGALTGAPGVADSRILFAHQVAPGRKEIFQVDPDGQNLIQITHHESLTISPAITNTGKIAYVTYADGLPRIWGQRKRHDVPECIYPINPKSSAMAFTPEWAPDGKGLALVQPDHRGDSDIFLLSINSGKLRQLTQSTGINTEPAWSPSGKQIAFTSDRDGTPQIYLMDKDGGAARRLPLSGTCNASPAWSPDGTQLAFASKVDGHLQLFVYNLSEGKAYQITRGTGSAESPSWSPDGRWIAFARSQEQERHLCVVNLTGTALWQVLDLPDCQSPQWTRSRG